MAWIDVDTLDETLLKRRAIAHWEPDDSGIGYHCRLACGHRVWMATQPNGEVHCAACLDVLKRQIGIIQAHQEGW